MRHEDPRLEALSHGHDRIRTGADHLRSQIRQGEIAAARRSFTDFAVALEAHMAAEERGVFATLGAMEEFAAAITHLAAEHDHFRALLSQAAVEHDDRLWAGVVGSLLRAFTLHELEEETDLFPAAEVALPLPAGSAEMSP